MERLGCYSCPLGVEVNGMPCYPAPEDLQAMHIEAKAFVLDCAADELLRNRVDDLTGFDTYQTFRQRLWAASINKRADEYRPYQGSELLAERPGAMIFIDGKDVHTKNHLHSMGRVDQGLANMAVRIDRLVRGGDLRCRRGGDEFIVQIIGDAVEVSPVVERLQKALSEGVPIPGTDDVLCATFYVAFRHHIGSFETAMAMIDEADTILHKRKLLPRITD